MMGIVSIYEKGKQNLIQAFDPEQVIAEDLSQLERDPYAPTFQIEVMGGVGAQPMGLTDDVLDYIDEVTYEDNADQFDKMTVKFTSQVDNKGGGNINSIIDNVLFAEGTMLVLKLGYGTSLITVGAADIVRKAPNFKDDGYPDFTLIAYDAMHRLARSRPIGGESYKNSTRVDIAEKIGQRNGLIVDANGVDGQPTIQVEKDAKWQGGAQKVGVSDYEFLKKVADSRSLDLFTRYDDTLRKHVLFMRKEAVINQKETFTFIYNENDVSYSRTLLSFEPDQDAFDQGSDIEIFILNKRPMGSSYDFIKKLTIEEQKKLKSEKERRFTGGNKTSGKQDPNFNGAQVGFKAFGRSFRFPDYKRFNSEEEVTNEIEAFLTRQKAHFITGTAKTIGVEALQSRQVHILAGVSEQFSGKYFFDKVVHKFSTSKGYYCESHVHRVIDDELVQAPPTLEFSDKDKTIQKFKKVTKKDKA